ncbi:MAG: RCC1 domain-containing protein, partial [Gemmatimonadota bacterium]
PAPDGTHPTVAGTPFTSLTSLDFAAGEASAPMVLYLAGGDTIRVTDGEIEAAGEHRLVVEVSPGAAAAITLRRTFLTMTMLGQTETLDATVFDEYDNDSGEAVDWSSSRVQVAPVASDGTVEAFRTGYAEVTAAIDALAETVPVRVQPLTITAGQLHTCAIELDGSAVCWGDDGSGKLGDGRPIEPQDAPSDVAGGHTWSQLGAGNLHSCGVTTDGDAYCWGYDGSDQLGNGSPASNTLEPSLVEDPADGPVTWLQVSGGYDHTCGLTRDGEAYCWGSDASEQLGNGATSGNQATPSPVADPASGPVTWTQVSAGGFHACGVTTDAEMYCWGSDASGQLGNGDGLTGDQATPTLVADPGSGSVSWARVGAGSFHTCGLTTDGEAYCWGRDASGELGNGDALTGDQTAPTLVADPLDGPVTWLHVGAYRYHTCGVSAAGVAYCWGGDASGQIGDGDETTGGTAVPSRTADPADGPVAFVHAVPGESHSCGVTSAGEAYCWGSDEYGQLGNGDMITGDQDEPSQVESANAFAALAPAPFARFALARRVTAASGGGDLR